jgi:hypothetical protein
MGEARVNARANTHAPHTSNNKQAPTSNRQRLSLNLCVQQPDKMAKASAKEAGLQKMTPVENTIIGIMSGTLEVSAFHGEHQPTACVAQHVGDPEIRHTRIERLVSNRTMAKASAKEAGYQKMTPVENTITGILSGTIEVRPKGCTEPFAAGPHSMGQPCCL